MQQPRISASEPMRSKTGTESRPQTGPWLKFKFNAAMMKDASGAEVLTFTVAPTSEAVSPRVSPSKLDMDSSVIRISELPVHVAAALAGLDLDGDGTIDVQELSAFHEKGERAVRKHKKYRKLFILLFVLFIFQLVATFGVVIGVVLVTRQSTIDGGVMVVKGTSTPVQVANSDTYIGSNGQVQQRSAPGASSPAGRRLLLQASEAFPYEASTSPTSPDFEPLYTSSDSGMPLPRLLAAEAPACDWTSPDFKQLTGSCSTAHKLSSARQSVVTFPLQHVTEGVIAQPSYATSVAYFKGSRSLACQGGQMYIYTFSATSSITICMHASLTADYTSDTPEFGTTAFIDYVNFTPPSGFSAPCTTVTGATTTSGAAMPPMCLYPASFAARAINASNVYDPNAAAAVAVRRKLLAADGTTSRGLLARATNATSSAPAPLTQSCADSCCNSGCCCLPSCTACSTV